MKKLAVFGILLGILSVSAILGLLVLKTTFPEGGLGSVLALKIQVVLLCIQDPNLSPDIALLQILGWAWFKVTALYFIVFCVALGAILKLEVDKNAP